MRWPLRNQILFPFASLTVATIVTVSLANVWLSTRRTKRDIETQLVSVSRTLAESSFPLSDAVLRQTRNLCGADLAVATQAGEITDVSSTRLESLPAEYVRQNPNELKLERILTIGDREFLYACVPLDRQPQGGALLELHIFYPVARWRAARDQAVLPFLLVGTVATLLVIALSIGIARHVTRPVARLQTQVERIAEGELQPMTLPRRNDEIRDLAISVNRMAQVLARYEESVRKHERLKTMGQLGGGLVHQLSNAATGCRLALDLHLRACTRRDDEDLQVATRQLSLIDKYLKQFLRTERPAERGPDRISLQNMVEEMLPLVTSHARHLDVQLDCNLPAQPVFVEGHREDLEQVLVNLLVNAIEATASSEQRNVRLSVSSVDEKHAHIEVSDTGRGPDKSLGERIFDPLTSTKPDGAGLGLAVAREVAQDHGGRLTWHRHQQLTTFCVDLPLAAPE